MIVEPFPLIRIQGPPRERGRQYGRAAADRIRKGIGHYSAQVARYQLSRDDIAGLADAYLPIIERFDCEYVEEMRGIAEGAGTTFEEVLLINARTEILKLAEKPHLRDRLTAAGETDGCTAVVVMPEATVDGQLIHAINWDWKLECVETGVVLQVSRDDGPDILTFTEAGALARSGLNANGVAITGNYLESERDYQDVGVPLPLIRRKALEADNLAQAMRAVYSTHKSASSNMIVSHGGGIAINFECAPNETFQVLPHEGLLVHANHWLSPVALSKLQDYGIQNMPSTLLRQQRAESLLRRKLGRITPSCVTEVLQDDFESPWSLCQPPRSNAAGVETATVARIVMQPALGQMRVTPLPSEGHPETFYTLGETQIRKAV
jgi:isopenicillin-N N-acyltransferase like protein